MDRQQEFVLRTIEDRDVRFVRMWFTDVTGTLKSVALAPAEVESAFEEGLGFDGSSIDGYTRISESDMLLQPDPATFQILPWRGDSGQSSRMFCDVLTPDGRPAPADPRHVLRRVLEKASDMGFSCFMHPEIEFYLLKSDQPGPDGRPVPVDRAGYFDNVPGSDAADFRRDAVTLLESMGISVEFSHHENGPGQNEIDLRAADALDITVVRVPATNSCAVIKSNNITMFIFYLYSARPRSFLERYIPAHEFSSGRQRS